MDDRLFREEGVPGDHAREFRAAALTRLGAAVAFAISITLLHVFGLFLVQLWPMLCTMAAQCVVILWSFRFTLSSRRAAFVEVQLELLAQTVVLWFLGPARIIVALVVYIFGLMRTGLRLTRFGVFLTANSAAASYALLVVLEARAVLPTFHANNITLEPAQAYATILIVLLTMNVAAWYVATFQEFSDERARALAAAQAELTEHSRHLEHTVRRRTAAIRQANEMLAEKNRELELYASAVSHDLRSPMVAAGEALRVARTSVDGVQERCLDLATKNLDRADRMLVGLRELMRTVGQREALDVVDVTGVVEEVVRELRAARGGEPLPVHVLGDLGQVRGQGEKLAHVFRNLLGNALEHAGTTDGVRIEIGREDADGEPCWFVRDDGVGIPYEYQARIFEPYRCGPDRAGESMGLGLALVSQIVAEHGGRTWVESDPGCGATFRFTVPGGEDSMDGGTAPI